MRELTTDISRLSADCRALLDLLDGARFEFERCQFQLWDQGGEDGCTLLLLSVQREHVHLAASSPGQGNGHDPVCRLTGDVVAWDVEAANWAYHRLLTRFLSLDELRAWLQNRHAFSGLTNDGRPVIEG